MSDSNFDSIEVGRRLSYNVAKVVVPTASVLALFATPYQLVPAPGAGKLLVFKRLTVHKAAGTAYGGIAAGEDLAVKYTNAAGAQVNTSLETTGFLDQATKQTRITREIVSEYTPVLNAALVLHLLTAEIITGTSDLLCTVEYETISEVESANVSF